MAYRSSKLEYTIVLLGLSNAGKTSIIYRIKNDEFVENTKTTIGVADSEVKRTIRGNVVTLTLVDTAGLERNAQSIPPQLYNKANAVGFVYDITQDNALRSLDFYVKKVDEHCIQEPLKFVVGNKYDLDASRRKVTIEELQHFAKEKKISIFFEISANSGYQFAKLIDTVVDELLSKEMKRHKIVIVGDSQVGKTKLADMLQGSEGEPLPTRVDWKIYVRIEGHIAHIIDTPGKEPHLSSTSLEDYSDADGFVFVFNCKSSRSYNIANDWFSKISGLKGRNENMQFMFIANNKGEKYAQNVVDFQREKNLIERDFKGTAVEQVNANDQAGTTRAFTTLCEKITSAKWAEDTKKPINLQDDTQQ